MTVFSANNLSKTYDRELLFDGISFGLESGERVGIIGRNGIGKTTLMKIIAGLEYPDTGEVVFNREIKLEYLSQSPVFLKGESALDAVLSAKGEIYKLLSDYHRVCSELNLKYEPNLAKKLELMTHEIENQSAWTYENEAKTILSRLGISDYNSNTDNLSGGLRKRVALARALISEPDLLLLDEPTNHLDADSVQWLQDRLSESNVSLLMVTHDRYFLDAVSNKIIEIDQKRLFYYPGNYESYLEKKEIMASADSAKLEHQLSRLRTELAWLQRGAKARRSKQKSRTDWVEKLIRETKLTQKKEIKIELGKSFLGSRIIDAQNIGKELGGRLLFSNYTYIAKPGDRIGIIGPNGSGKSTLLNVLAGYMKSDTGTVKQGMNTKIGYFTQENIELKDSQTVVGTLREVAEFIDTGIGRDRFLTVKDLLNRFLFPLKQHGALVGTLSGGERRRLALLKVLMDNPNVLLLDEPTNDFDIPTLQAFEEYLENFYGVLIIVSHDRAFLDRTVSFIQAFDGIGGIKEYPGNYSYYLEKKESELQQRRIDNKLARSYQDSFPDNNNLNNNNNSRKNSISNNSKKKLSYLEQREYSNLEKEIQKLESEKDTLETEVNSGNFSDYKLLETKSHRLVELSSEIEIATERWFELAGKLE